MHKTIKLEDAVGKLIMHYVIETKPGEFKERALKKRYTNTNLKVNGGEI